MADITIPTAQNIKMKFKPAFDDADPATLEFAIEEAALEVDDSWTKDHTLAIMYLAAHLVAMAANTGSEGGRVVISETIGRISTTYAQMDATARADFYQGTVYGQRFAQLRNRNHSGALIV